MVENAFLTESRREVLDGTTDLTNQSLRNAKSRIRVRARLALEELIEVAASTEIDNADVFTEQEMKTLVHLLLHGDGGLIGDDVDDELPEAWEPDTEYALSLYTALNTQLRHFEDRHEQSLDATNK